MNNRSDTFLGEIKRTLLAVFLVFTFVSISFAETFKLPDTGQTTCYDGAGNVINPCPTPGDPLAQDGSYSVNLLSYTDNGNGTVTDNNTGLIWQKDDDNTTYNWYQAAGIYDTTYNPTSMNVCGDMGAGWRLPTKKELMSIVDYSIPHPGPTINPIFTNTKQSFYWSSTTYAGNPDLAGLVNFYHGGLDSGGQGHYFYVRCVRGEQPATSFTDNGNGTVTDTKTGLVWQQGETGYMTWPDALNYCENLQLPLGSGQSDWRLPNFKELESIIDDMVFDPVNHPIAIDTNAFPNASASNYWSSTTYAGISGYAWSVGFGNSYVYSAYYDKGNDFYVRCVRGGATPPTPYWAYPVLPYVPGSYAGRSFFYDQNHLGEDIALPVKTPVSAIGPGVIKYYSRAAGYGELVVVVEHDLGEPVEFTNAYGQSVSTRYILSIYGHLRKCIDRRGPTTCTGLKVGDTVTADTIIGYVNDDAHNGDGAEHLHMGIRLSDAATAKSRDPRAWFRGYERRTNFGTDFTAASEAISILLGQ